MKTKWTIGIIAAVVALVLIQFYLLPGSYRATKFQIGGSLVMLSVAIGIVLSVTVTRYIVAKLIEGKPIDPFGLTSAAPRGTKIGSYVVAVASSPIALFFGFVVGGTLGGGIAEYLLHWIDHSGSVSYTIGIGLGIFVVGSLILLIAALAGFILGGLTEKLVRKLHA